MFNAQYSRENIYSRLSGVFTACTINKRLLRETPMHYTPYAVYAILYIPVMHRPKMNAASFFIKGSAAVFI